MGVGASLRYSKTKTGCFANKNKKKELILDYHLYYNPALEGLLFHFLLT